MNIAVTSEDVVAESTHQELHPTQILSVVASLTPFSDFNQSPRNMYQCQVPLPSPLPAQIVSYSLPLQMAKQTMGTPFHAFPYRTDGGKVYRIQHPQKPLVRNLAQEKYNLNDYPHGCNAVVAVISYTGTYSFLPLFFASFTHSSSFLSTYILIGYDMEDAMIINKSAYERGFGHASVYITEFVNVVPKYASFFSSFLFFCFFLLWVVTSDS